MEAPVDAASKCEIAAMFDQAADLLEIKGDNPFRTRAHHRAARVIERLPKSIANLVQAGEDLSELPGIGKDLAGKVGAIVSSGRFDLLESLKRQLPGDLGEIAALPGLGPKRVKLLYDKLGIRSIADLRRALKAHRLRELRGFAAKSEERLLATLAKPASEKRFKLAVAEEEARSLVDYFGHGLGKGKVTVAGSHRRRRDTVGDLDILVTARPGTATGEKLAKYENVTSVIAHGPSRTAVVLRSGLHVDLRVVPNRDNMIAANRDRFRPSLLWIHGINMRVDDNDVRRGGRFGGCGECRSHEQHAEPYSQEVEAHSFCRNQNVGGVLIHSTQVSLRPGFFQ